MKDKLAKGIAWLGTAKIIVNLLALCSTIILARLLTPADFGLVAIVMALLAIVESVTDLSLAAALIHHSDPSEDHFHTAWTLNLTRGAVIAIIFCALSPLISYFYHDSRLTEIMWVIGASIFITGFANPKMVVLSRQLIFWQEFVMTVTQKIAGFTVSVVLALIYKSYWALIGGIVASQIIGVFVTYLIIEYRPKFTYKYSREIWSFSIWLTLGKIVNTLNWKFDHLMIGSYLDQNKLGFYTVGDNLAGLPSREAIQPLENTLFPGFKQLASEPERLRNAYVRAQALVSALALPLGVGFALVSHSLILFLMGNKWLPAVQVIQVISCVYVLQTLGSQVHPLAMALGKTRFLFNRDVISFFIRLPIIITGMFFWGLTGVIYARAISGTISLFINMHLIDKMITLSITQQIKSNIRALSSVIIMGLVVLIQQNLYGVEGTKQQLILKLIVFVITGVVTYIGTHILLWFAMKKPDGPETELIKIFEQIRMKLKFKKLK